jgi:peptidoglycan/LPS O-acetylase OafA/YrhL
LRYRPEIDGLRAIAIIPVILFHAGFKIFSGGFVGVDIFFVISGYLITTIIIAELSEGRFSIINFYERRARRILPVLFFVMLSCLPFAWLWLLPQDMKIFSQSLIAVSTFASNILFWRTSGYFDAAAELNPLLHTWSLAVEEQFYLFFPLLLILAWRLSKRWILLTLVIFAFVSLIGAEWGAINKPTANFYLLPTRCWELLIGALLASYFSNSYKPRISNIISDQVGGIVGFALIIYSVFFFDSQTPFPSVYTLAPTIGAALIILFATQQTLVGKLLSNKLFVGVGLISYSAYLWHQPLFAFAKHRSLDESNKLLMCTLVITSVVLAYFSWKYIETPFRNKKDFSQKQIFAYGLIGSVFFVAIGISGSFTDGYANRFLSIAPLLSTRSDHLQRVDECFLLNANANTFDLNKCSKKTSGKRFNILLLGDSHAASLYPGLKKYLDGNDVNVEMMTAAYCVPLVEHFPKNKSQTATSRCELINQKFIGLLSSQKFDLVVISSFMLEWGFRGDPKWSYPGYYVDFVNKVKLINSKVDVLIVGQFPVWTDNLPNILLKESIANHYESAFNIPNYSSFGIDNRIFLVNDVLKNDFTSVGIKYISIVDKLCNKPACMRFVPAKNYRKLITFDYGHLGMEASSYISDNIVGPEILKSLNTD